ncbi:MAG: LysR substrate-binding domain-containing protein [Pigmentiphaga sp.]|uniref:LysR substrate-binding domain-containing protein n=1 Tax=Pigmentiphaga sp. TaxID=1977564 RepID=UPI0029A78E85|nr:LysR substrate-binding domain-containing protein [Pigmentiphaga sp.]MDX3906874.1 LysR substrate-binding domain-containing protein [Pigmentiphaga sp.]
MRFDLTDLRLFLHVVAAGSITAGSERAHLSLASGSARLRQLEATLGTALLERGRRGVIPTPAGQALARHARLLQYAERMQDDLGHYARGLRGQVRLWCNTAGMSVHLPEPLADFLVRHPEVDVELQEHPSHRIAHAVREGAADLGIVSDAVDLAGLAHAPFRPDPLVLVAPAGHPLATGRPVRFTGTLDYDYVGLAQDSALALHLEDHALRAGRRLRIRVRAGGLDALVRMVARGVGLGIVPEAAACGPCEGVVAIRLDEPWAERRLMLCARDFDALAPYARGLVAGLLAPEAAGRA